MFDDFKSSYSQTSINYILIDKLNWRYKRKKIVLKILALDKGQQNIKDMEKKHDPFDQHKKVKWNSKSMLFEVNI